MVSLSDLQENEECHIVGYSKGGTYRRQLLSLGLTPGTKIKMIRNAPLGDPVEFELLGFRLCLRRKEAGCIQIKKI
ncbi:MAG: ferrous iron transport protein A [Endozoicomonadaceae bacterium]|nr:ferrous iron transport protein A [Endozoicomonadaceae bacterium]